MLKPLAWSILVAAELALAHGGHDASGPNKGETIQQYAQRHMSKEHHIDSFDIRSFFHLHDLNRDGFWDRAEVEAVYGVHHTYSPRRSKDEIEQQKNADHVADTVLGILDLNKDGRVSVKELEQIGLDGLPNFDHIGAEGHHYDEESEFFLHHEEEFHSTPESQTDEAYVHKEDIEHFAQHEKIEQKETEREAKFQGISVDELIRQQLAAAEAYDKAKAAEDAKAAAAAANGETPVATADTPKVTRIRPPEKVDPRVKYADVREEALKGEYGEGPAGYKSPVKPEEKMKRNTPYKYKFKRNWGDF